MGIGLLILLGFVYFIPTIVGINKVRSAAIFWLNFLLGWTIAGWVGALIWAMVDPKRPELDPIARERHQRIGVAVHGDMQRNADGTHRQRIIAQLKMNEPVTLIREPQNPVDRNAIRVDSAAGTIGYIAPESAGGIAYLCDSGAPISARISAILGGTPDKPNRQVLLEIATGRFAEIV